MKPNSKIIIFLFLFVLGFVFVYNFLSIKGLDDRTNVTKVQFNTFHHIYTGLNILYEDNSDLKFPIEFNKDTLINGKRVDSAINVKIFNGDPWGKPFQYIASEDRKFSAIISGGPNKKKGNITLNNNGELKGFQKDDIYVIYAFNEKDLNVVVQREKYFPKYWE